MEGYKNIEAAGQEAADLLRLAWEDMALVGRLVVCSKGITPPGFLMS